MAKAKRKNSHSTHRAAHHSANTSRHASPRQRSHARRQHSGDPEKIIAAGEEHFGRFQKSARSAFDTLGVFSGPMSYIMDHNWSMFQKTMQTVQEGSLRFFNRRLEHTSHLIEESRDFRGVSGLMQIQQEWIVDFARDFSDQATRIANRMRELAVDSTERMTEAASEALEDGAREKV